MAVTLNPDKEVVRAVKEGLKRTGGYCPCRLERTEENRCMCKEFREQIADLVITEQNFEEEVLRAKQPVLVDFWATWCGPCRMLAPVIEEIANEYEGKVKVGKVNVDDERELALQFGVNSIPTVMVFQNGEIKATSVGYRPKEEIEQLLK